jgi:hypothetical protein
MVERSFCRHPIETQPENGVPNRQFPMQRTRRAAREQATAQESERRLMNGYEIGVPPAFHCTLAQIVRTFHP